MVNKSRRNRKITQFIQIPPKSPLKQTKGPAEVTILDDIEDHSHDKGNDLGLTELSIVTSKPLWKFSLSHSHKRNKSILQERTLHMDPVCQ